MHEVGKVKVWKRMRGACLSRYSTIWLIFSNLDNVHQKKLCNYKSTENLLVTCWSQIKKTIVSFWLCESTKTCATEFTNDCYNFSLPLNPIDTSAKISKLLKLVPLTKFMLIMLSFINKGAKRNLFEWEECLYKNVSWGCCLIFKV